jgi:hypothetical protein
MGLPPELILVRVVVTKIGISEIPRVLKHKIIMIFMIFMMTFLNYAVKEK